MSRPAALCVGAFVAVAALAGAAGAPRVAAHRGGIPGAPENSLVAYRAALALGVDLLETDVHLTRDGAVVVLHDPVLDRTTTGTGPVARTMLTELRQHRLRDRRGAPTGEAVPTLGELLDLLGPAGAELLLEIKVDGEGQRYPGIEQRVVALLTERGMLGRTVVMAFEPETLAEFRRQERRLRLALLVGRGQVQRERVWPAESVRRAVGLGAALVALNHRLVDEGVVAAARAAGLGLAAWTVNEEADLQRVIRLGVDVLITDRPEVARELLRRPPGGRGGSR